MKKRCLADDGYWKRKLCNKECEYYDSCSYRLNKTVKENQLKKLKETEDYYVNSNRHDASELQIMQGYSLERKIQLTCERINAWYEWWDGNVYMSFSGGKDSTVLLDLVRNRCGLNDVPAVFVDTGLEYPEIREFVKTFDNVEWLKPKMNFKQVIQKYGYPFFTKEVSGTVYAAKKYLKKVAKEENIENVDLLKLAQSKDKWDMPYRVSVLLGTFETYWSKKKKGLIEKDGEPSRARYAQTKYQFMLKAPFDISSQCCNVMKKAPMHKYSKSTGRKPMTGQTAQESQLRKKNWLQNGCNGFYMKEPISNPMAFWTEQDILEYIKKNNIRICSVYGDVVEDLKDTEEVEGQLTFSDLEGFENYTDYDAEKPKLKTTGCNRTGCMFCGYGCHLEKEGEGRFERMKQTHPKQYEYIMKPVNEGGLGYKEVIDWINEKGNMHIRY